MDITEEVIELISLFLDKEDKEYINAVLYGYRTTTLCAASFSKKNKKYFPEKKTNMPIWKYILLKADLKKCSKCNEIKDIYEFSKNESNSDGLQAECKYCVSQYKKTNKYKFRAYANKRRSCKLKAIPKWVTEKELKEIEIFYKNCPSGWHVDHIEPLQNDSVCGLHCIDNLQYLSASDNLSKGNKRPKFLA